MPKLIATKLRRYGNRRLKEGDPFEASARDARYLIPLGLAKEDLTPPPIPQYETRVLTAEAEEIRPRRRYRHRDMTAKK